MNKTYDLEDRLVNYASLAILFGNKIKDDYAGNHLKKQLIRSTTSPALNYGEAQAAESRRDFIHKNKIVLKELKESRVNLKILSKTNYGDLIERQNLVKETEELIAIFASIVRTAEQNSQK